MRSVLGTAGAFQTPHISVDMGPNGIDHTLICKKGGYVSMRHNALRDLNAEMQREVFRDVVTEPRLLPLDGETVEGTAAYRAAPDISSRGVWSTFERTFYDVRVFHPNAVSYRNQSLSSLYSTHERERKWLNITLGFSLWKESHSPH